jgi:acyl CoA:acetate/3-ketoacid CoA transferase alpha subunit
VLESGKPRETRIFDGKTYVMETALKGDVAILRAWKVDEAGNCVFRCVPLALMLPTVTDLLSSNQLHN